MQTSNLYRLALCFCSVRRVKVEGRSKDEEGMEEGIESKRADPSLVRTWQRRKSIPTDSTGLIK
ncbi:MAG: hypothetical protein P4M11_02175 [Candidatus Pacebacteria bacterium]|nr:hypothetical protein [Candidatus Paceibacterota bacterium]